MLVDCDIHVGYHSLRDLLPHLDGPTAELVLESGTNGLGMPSYPWYHPSGWLRTDTYDREAAVRLEGDGAEELPAVLAAL